MLAGEVSRLERALGPAAAAAAVARCRDASGRTALILSSRVGDLDGVDACVRARCGGGGGDDDDASGSSSNVAAAAFIADGANHGISALTLASWQGHTHVVDYLLRRGADANRRDDFGVAALHKSVGHGHLTTALRLLCDGGTDPHLRVGSISDRIPAEYRAVARHQTALHIACYRRKADGSQAPGDARMVAALLRHGADPTVADDHGNTALHYACGACDLPVARLLMRAGADPRARNTAGRTAGEAVPPAGGSSAAAAGKSPLPSPSCSAAHLIFDALDGAA